MVSYPPRVRATHAYFNRDKKSGKSGKSDLINKPKEREISAFKNHYKLKKSKQI